MFNHHSLISRLFLFIFLSLFLFPAAAAAEATFYNQEQLEYALTSQKPSALEFTCSGSLYAELQEGEFRELFRLLARSGIDYNAANVSYNDFRHFIGLSGLSYTDLPWAECETLADVRRAVSELAPLKSDFILLCSNDLLHQLTNGHSLSVYGARNGIKSFTTFYSTQTGILKITDPDFFDRSWAIVEDYAQFAAAVSVYAGQEISDFYVVFDPDLFAKITEDPTEMTIMTGSSKLTGYNAGIDMNSCVFHYYDVTFTDAPREICRSVSDAAEAIRRMGAVGIRDFELIFPYTDIFNALYENDFARFQEIRTQAGMVSGDISYSEAHDRIIFHNAEIVPEVTALSTLAEAIAYTAEQTAADSRDIHLFCSADLYQQLTGYRDPAAVGINREARIYDLLPQAGIFDYDITTSDATHLINIHINQYFPGTAIVRAVQNGDLSPLNEREQMTLTAAASVAEAALDPDPLQTAKAIHDWLCDRIIYTDDEATDEDDNAIGAILNGEANCDGYADAFYLIGSLAGLEIRYQHGDSLDQHDLTDPESVSHLWNLIRIDGSWRMVDVTWDDEAGGHSYLWFNVGSDIASRMHVWNEDMSVPILETTLRPFSIGNDFYVSSRDELYTAIDSARSQRLSDFHIVFTDPALSFLNEEARQTVMSRSYGASLSYSWNEQMSALGLCGVRW